MEAPYTERYVRCYGRGTRLKGCQLYPIITSKIVVINNEKGFFC